jgi:hypothetical protein
MRASEILGLRGEYIFDEYIHVHAQYDEYGYRPTKTKEKRNIPLAPMIINELRQIACENNNGYVFSLDGGETPVTRRLMYNKFHKALRTIGMTQEEIKRRGLSMHSWRHFFNTTLQMANVALSKVQSVTGHKSDRMTEWYTHFDSKEFAEVRSVQGIFTFAGDSGLVKKGFCTGVGDKKQRHMRGRITSKPWYEGLFEIRIANMSLETKKRGGGGDWTHYFTGDRDREAIAASRFPVPCAKTHWRA